MAKKKIIIPIFIPHMGCPHCCVFCNQWRISSASKKADAQKIKETIELYLSHIGSSVKKVELAFFGGSFTAIPSEEQIMLLSVVKPYIQDGIIDSVRISTRPDYIDRGKLDLLAEYNVETVELGVQSFNDKVLEYAERGHSAEDVYRAMEILGLYQFRTGIQLMPGLPGDSFLISRNSAVIAADLAPDDARIYPLVVLKGTRLEKMYSEKKYTPLSVEEAVEVSAEMYKIFSEKDINVIRIGLHPLDLEEETVVAGPYHTALGFLVKSRYRRDMLEEAAKKRKSDYSGKDVLTLVIPALFAEEYIGMKKSNIEYIKSFLNVKRVEYIIRDVEKPFIEG
jgi:histone acetyltransferase (RNA polymerase elongator complex component)